MIQISQCAYCKNYDRVVRGVCAAFPDGIPDEIMWGVQYDHRQPYPGDHNIQFEALNEAADIKQRRLFVPLTMAEPIPIAA